MVGNVPGHRPVIHGSWSARTATPGQSVRLRAHAIALAAALLATAAEADRRVAFVIGNAAYRNATSLPNTINDANAVAALFRSFMLSPARSLFLATTFALLRLQFFQVFAQAIEARVPEAAIILQPVVDVLERPRLDAARPGKVVYIPSFLQPLDKPVPMVATADIGRTAAELLQETWSGHRVLELEGSQRVTPNEIASTFAHLLGRPVRVEAVPREAWESLFKSQGMRNPTPRIQMLDGFNEGWIEFEGGEVGSRKGNVTLQTVLHTLIERESKL